MTFYKGFTVNLIKVNLIIINNLKKFKLINI
jgi:hypothetical protein